MRSRTRFRWEEGGGRESVATEATENRAEVAQAERNSPDTSRIPVFAQRSPRHRPTKKLTLFAIVQYDSMFIFVQRMKCVVRTPPNGSQLLLHIFVNQ